nr:acyltransferase [uncultured Dethiosulfovibrio sp.]
MNLFDSFMTREELEAIGFASLGQNLLISRKASFYYPEKITIGDNVRIDDFCLLSGNISIGSFIHIGSYVCMMGQLGIVLKDYSQISFKTTLFSATDDFSGEFLVGPQVPDSCRHIIGGQILLEKHALLGASSLVLPKTKLLEGAVTGAGSLVFGILDPWSIYWGNPLKFIKKRSQKMLTLI